MSMHKSHILTLAAVLATVTMAGGVTAAELARRAQRSGRPGAGRGRAGLAAAPETHEIEVGDM